jgi:hypothetical protein
MASKSRVEAAKIIAGKDSAKKTESASFNWTGEAAKHFGAPSTGLSGSSGAPSKATLALATSAREIYDANVEAGKKITPQQALELAAKVSAKK